MPVSPATRGALQLDRRTVAVILLGVALMAAALAVLARRAPAGVIPAGQKPAREMRVEVLASYPHDRRAFTQGLLYHDGVLYESTGLEGESTLRRVDVTTGRVLQSVALPPNLFAEGLALAPEGLVQVTWQNDTGFVYDAATLAPRCLPATGEPPCDHVPAGMTDGSGCCPPPPSWRRCWRPPR